MIAYRVLTMMATFQLDFIEDLKKVEWAIVDEFNLKIYSFTIMVGHLNGTSIGILITMSAVSMLSLPSVEIIGDLAVQAPLSCPTHFSIQF